MTPVFLLAAGLGTRLRPLTDQLPKPLLPVGDRPALAHILGHLRAFGGPVVANAHHRADELRAFLDAHAPQVVLSVEEEILGTAGGLERATDLLGGGAVLVWNGDILAELDPSVVLSAHESHRDALATLAVQSLPAGEGNVGTDESRRVVRLRTETALPGEVFGGLFLGIHLVGEELRARLPERGCLVGDVYLPALRLGETLRTVDVGALAWQDIGTLEDYRAANLAWLDARGVRSFVGEGAIVASGVMLDRSIVGAGAQVGGSGPVVRSIVWPGACAVAPLTDVVVTPTGCFGI